MKTLIKNKDKITTLCGAIIASGTFLINTPAFDPYKLPVIMLMAGAYFVGFLLVGKRIDNTNTGEK